MKTLELKNASKPLSDYAAQVDAEGIVLTSKKKPVAALVSVKGADKETLALSMSKAFGKLIRRARSEVKRGRVVPLQQLKQELATYRAVPNKPSHGKRRKPRR